MKAQHALGVVLCGLTVAVTLAVGAEAPKKGAVPARDASLYVGMKSCGMCHRAPASGDQLTVWKGSAHAKAFETLGTPEAKAAGAKVGVADPQTSPKCLKCHSTAFNFGDSLATAKITPQEGVTCESCHGPGKNYMAKAVMESREKSIAGGMIYPASAGCTMCHNEESPSWKADRYTLKDGKKVGFDYEQAFAKIKHDDPKVSK